MASTRISYQFKIFAPIAGMLCLILIGSAIFLAEREKAYKFNRVNGIVKLINASVLDIYNRGGYYEQYMDFIEDYFDKSVLDNLSIALYDTSTGERIYEVGFTAPPPDEIANVIEEVRGEHILQGHSDEEYEIDPEKAFVYITKKSHDGKVIIQTILPPDDPVVGRVRTVSWWWIYMGIVCVLVLIVTYIATRHLMSNIRILREFSSRAAEDRDFVSVGKFSNDELGDISRQIVNIYNTRKAARASRDLEHRVALKATEERSNMRRQLTDNINHELKTPAGIIRGYIDTILSSPDMDEEARNHFLKKTQDHVERLCNILNDLSTMTRLEEGADNVQLSEIDFKKFITTLDEDLEESHVLGNMTLSYDIPDGCIVRANATLLTAAIMNMVKNAVAYSGGTQISIRKFAENKRFYTFTFADNGRGVDEEHLPHLFTRFYRVDKGRSRKNGGTGLGLAIVRSSLNTMGGSISVKNADTGGLMFIFTLRKPLSGDNPDAAVESL